MKNSGLLRRLAALEGPGLDWPRKWVRIIGGTEAEARADYEAEHGPIDHEAGVIFHRIIDTVAK
jgi:hypothetical protein